MKVFNYFLLLFAPIGLFAQTIVSTTPTNKNVVLEEFTGINCGYCPQGHTIANQIATSNPGRVVVINVHTGTYANPQAGQPDFRTSFGTSLMTQSVLTGFPAGTVNRHVFPGYEMSSGNTAMGRSNWTSASNTILAQSSCLNIGATATIDVQSRELEVYVEVYYTGNSETSTNKLNVALLQNNTIGYQAGGGAEYNHMHRLVHLITGQWGETISTTTNGTLYTKTLTYTIPEKYNSIPAMLEDMELGIFVSEGNQEVITGILVEPDFVNAPPVDFKINDFTIPDELNSATISPQVEIKSYGNETLTSLDISYQINDDTPVDFEWNGSLQFGESVTVDLPTSNDFVVYPENSISISINTTDGTPENNEVTASIAKAPVTTFNSLTVEVRTDSYGTELTWNIKNASNQTVAGGGPYTDAIQTHTHNINLPVGDYTLSVSDSYGDGFPGGHLKLIANGESIILVDGDSFSSSVSRLFRVAVPATVNYTPEDGSTEVPHDGQFTIQLNKRLFASSWIPVDNTNVNDFVILKYNSDSGENVNFNATINEQGNTITVTPYESFDNNQVLYLSLDGSFHDEDGLAITNSSSTFTVNFYILSYSYGGGGTLSGKTYQIVNYGDDGTPVTAIPDEHYHFVEWCDYLTENPRIDENVTANVYVTALFAIDTYSLTYLAGDGGTIDGNANQTINYGDNGSQVTATPNTGYYFVKWSDEVTENPRTDLNVTEDITVTAIFQIYQYTLTYTAGSGGSLVGETSQTVDYGTNGSTVTAVPNTGFHFVKWSDDLLTATRTDENITSDLSVSAEFAINTYTLTYTAGEGGTISGTSPQTVDYGTDGSQVEAVPNSGYYFASWSDGSTENPRTDTDVEEDIEVVANFAQNGTFYITLVPSQAGMGTLSGGGQYSSGETATVEATPNTGYEFVSWTENESIASNQADYSFTVSSNRILVGNFEVQTFQLSYSAGENGSISGEAQQTVNYGSNGSAVSAVPAAGYHFVQWSDGLTDNPRTDENVTADITVTAEFAVNAYTLTYAAGENGSIDGESPQTVNHGENGAQVLAVPNAGYHFVQWSDGLTENPRTDSNVTEDISVTAEFAINIYTLAYSSDENGTLEGDVSQTVQHGDDGSAVAAVPNVGYHFAQWSDEVTDNPRTDLNVVADIDVTAEFAINTYTLTYTAGENGTITGASEQVVNYGEDGTEVLAAANSGYHFVKWSDEKTDNPRTDLNVTADVSVTAIFTENTHELSLLVTPENSGTVSGGGEYPVNQDLEISASANEGFVFVSWNNDQGIAVSTESSFTFTMPDSDTNLTAVFEEETVNPELYTIIFSIKNAEEQPVEGALINVEGLDNFLETNENGIATTELEDGAYSYSVTASGFEVFTGSITVDGADLPVNIVLTTVGVDFGSLSNIEVYPNPFSERFNINNSQLVSRIVVANLMGQVVFDITNAGSESVPVKLDDLPSGIYIVRLVANNGDIKQIKIVKE